MPLTKWLGPGVLLLGCVALTFAVARSDDEAPSAAAERPRDVRGFSVPIEIFEVGESVTVREVRIDHR